MTLEDIAEQLNEISQELHTVKRGVYGDKENGRPGLIETDKEQHKRIKDLEEFRKKALWFGSGAIAIIELAAHADEIIGVFVK